MIDGAREITSMGPSRGWKPSLPPTIPRRWWRWWAGQSQRKVEMCVRWPKRVGPLVSSRTEMEEEMPKSSKVLLKMRVRMWRRRSAPSCRRCPRCQQWGPQLGDATRRYIYRLLRGAAGAWPGERLTGPIGNRGWRTASCRCRWIMRSCERRQQWMLPCSQSLWPSRALEDIASHM